MNGPHGRACSEPPARAGYAGRLRAFARSLRVVLGMPDYDAYLTHMAKTHPEAAPLSYDDFFRERLEARYGGGPGRCC